MKEGVKISRFGLSDRKFLQQLKDVLHSNLEKEQFGVEELAREVNLSRSQLYRKLLVLTGQSPSKFIRNYRLQKAYEMLQKKEGTTSEIAYKVGFRSPSYFSTCFQKQYGYSPGKTFPESRKKGSVFWFRGILLSVVISLVAAVIFIQPFKGQKTGSAEKSIVVLPCKNLSADPENIYYADGMMEAILSHLSKIGGLRVVSSTSSMQYRGMTGKTLQEIGKELAVTHFLKGSVQIHENNIRIIVQLIDIQTGDHLWAETYDRALRDLFAIQSEIARSIAEKLEIQLTSQEKGKIETPSTENLRAYQYYLQAEHYRHNWGFSSNRRDYESAIQLYQNAEKEDSTFALALTQRAGLYWAVANRFGILSQEIDIDSILILCNQAIAIDPNLGSAYKVRGLYYDRLRNEIDKAKADFEKAWELDPNRYSWQLGHFYFRHKKKYIYGLQLMHRQLRFEFGDPMLIWHCNLLGYKYLELGDTGQAWHLWEQAMSLQPDFAIGLQSQIELSLWLRNWDRAYQLLQKFNSLYPTRRNTLELFGMYFLHTKNYKKALEYFDNALKLSYESHYFYEDVIKHTCLYGMTLWLNGSKEEGKELIKESLVDYLKLDRLLNSDREVRIAGIYTFLGNKKEAYYWLGKSKWTNSALYEVNQDFLFFSINREQEFQAIVNSIIKERRKVREEIARLKAAGQWELKF